TPYNLLLAPGRTVGIDFLARGSMPVTFDICRFLVYMDVHRIFLTRGGALQRHGCNRHDLDVFMSGYGDSLAGLPARDFLYVHFSEVMRRWAAIILLKAQGKATQRYKRALEMYRVGRMARHIAKGLSRSL